MSFLYGGKTLNGIEVDDMIKDGDDYVYSNPKLVDKLFVRDNRVVSYTPRGRREIWPKVALVVYHDNAPYEPLYGKLLEPPYKDYWDDNNCPTQKLKDAVKGFWSEVKDNYDVIMAEYKKRMGEKIANDDIPDTVDEEYDELDGDDKEFGE